MKSMYKRIFLTAFTLCVCAATSVPAKSRQAGPGLPLVVLAAAPDSHMPLVVFISGDGGWKDFDPRLASQFVASKCPVVALNALHYFWSRRTPEETTAAVTQLLETYMKKWDKQTFILGGFSFGADVMPFVLNRLPDSLVSKCRGVALFSPGPSTDFEIHVSQMLSDHRQWPYNVVTEIARRRAVPMLCFFGSEEHDFPLSRLSGPGLQVVRLAGGHHYEKNSDDIAGIVLARLGISGDGAPAGVRAQ